MNSTRHTATMVNADCVDYMHNMAASSIDSIVCDPPYGLKFMGKGWDSMDHGNAQQAWHARWLREAFRVLKPGGLIVAFGGSRTYHRLVCAAEDVGFEIRDSLHWMYGSGFPKSLNVGKAIDRAAGAEREVIGPNPAAIGRKSNKTGGRLIGGHIQDRANVDVLTAPATPEAKQWEGWGTALKPAHEPVLLARKPLIGTVAANVLLHGTGAINVDACRVGTTDQLSCSTAAPCTDADGATGGTWNPTSTPGMVRNQHKGGRWPANILLTHSAACVVTGARTLRGDNRAGQSKGTRPGGFGDVGADSGSPKPSGALYGDAVGHVYDCAPDCPVAALDGQPGATGGASRFYPSLSWDSVYDAPFLYNAKAAKKEREQGRPADFDGKRWNTHPTVKPVAVMRWLTKLVTPPGGVVLDPFMGSGTAGIAAIDLGVAYIGIEVDPDYYALALARVEHVFP